jgi:beta-1,4-mannosyl-glycoprotein beta-1,4-N-acetylglucosaminyltransferase
MKEYLSMKIFDCFTYYNEKEILKLRLEELSDYVDHFIIVEASETFTGKSKPYYFDEDPDIFSKWYDKIFLYRIDFKDNNLSSWDREYIQRNSISDALKNIHIDDEDLIIISDVDEIWNYKTVENLRIDNEPVRLDVKQYFWNYHWQVPDHCNQGARPVVCKKNHLESTTPQELRSMALPTIPNGGWHFSFLGEEDNIKNKIESFAHTEYDKDEFKSDELIMNRIKYGIDPFDRFPLKYQEIDDTYPSSLFKNK